MLKKVALAVAAALAAQAASAAAIDYHGYMRSSAGSTSEGGECVKFKLDGAGFPGAFRLGNECGDNYTEHAFSTIVGKGQNGSKFTYHTRYAFGVPNRDSYENVTIANRENFVTAEGVLGDTKIWMGKRFYRESDLHIRDYYYWDMSGTGFGVESIALGTVGKLDVGYIKNQRDGEAFQSAHLFDVNWSGIPLWSGAQLQLRAGIALPNGKDNVSDRQDQGGGKAIDADNAGFALMAVLSQNMLNGFNKLIIQNFAGAMASPSSNWYANGSGKPDTRASSDANTFRILDYIAIEPTASFGLHGLVVYEKAEGAAEAAPGSTGLADWGMGTISADGRSVSSEREWFAIGVRPIWSVTDNFALQGEVAYESTEVTHVDSEAKELTKFTIAPTFRPGKGIWSRPEMRFFVTYADWNEAAGNAGTGTVFVDDQGKQDTSGMTYGVQLEAWW